MDAKYTKYKRYNEDFKRNPPRRIKLVESSGRPMAEVAQKLAIPYKTLERWRVQPLLRFAFAAVLMAPIRDLMESSFDETTCSVISAISCSRSAIAPMMVGECWPLASAFVRLRSAALTDPPIVNSAVPVRPPMPEMLTMLPRLACR